MKKSKSDPKAPLKIVAKDPALEKGELKRVGGSQSDDWNNRIVSDVAGVLWLKNSTQDEKVVQIGAVVAGLIGIAPRDELEGMMAAQLVAAHSASMECFRRAMIGEQTFAGRSENLSQANKLSRTFAMLLDALNRHRGKGQQKVTVEHVHVHAGGQAIVGAVDTPGGGIRQRNEEQPHAKQIAHAQELPLRRSDQKGKTVPVGSDG